MDFYLRQFIWVIFCLTAVLIISCSPDDTEHPDPNPPDPEPPEFTVPVVKDIIMYEVNIRAFGPEANFNAVIDRLDEIEKLNVNVLWLMPIHPIGEINSVNSPYSVQDYKAINTEFGAMIDFKRLVEESHKRNIAVIIDWVANHTAWDNPWINNEDWYTQDGAGNIVHPPGTNWLDVADLNYENHAMRMAMIDAMKYWITDIGVDGFRCDAADMVPFDFWKEAIISLKEIPDKSLILLAEGARKDHFTAGFQMTYGWDFYSTLKQVFNGEQLTKMLFVIHQSEYSGVPDDGKRLRFTTNHDESAWDATPVVLFNGDDGALAASVVATYVGGVPLIYGSQEVGVSQPVPFFSTSTIDWSQKPQMLEAYHKIFEHYNQSETAKQTDLTYFEHNKIIAFMKMKNNIELLVLVNSTSDAFDYNVPDLLKNSSWINAMNGESFELGDQLEFQGYDYYILQQGE